MRQVGCPLDTFSLPTEMFPFSGNQPMVSTCPQECPGLESHSKTVTYLGLLHVRRTVDVCPLDPSKRVVRPFLRDVLFGDI